MIDVLIVDDEAPARRHIRNLLGAEADMCIVGESNNVPDALAKIEAMSPELLFLDIRMPGLTGLDLLTKLDKDNHPQVIFTTAYTNHAVFAFECDALDYLVKPIERERFHMALGKMRRRIPSMAAGCGEKFAELPMMPPAKDRHNDRIAIRIGRGTRILKLGRIVRIATDGDYLDIHLVNGEKLRTRERMHNMEVRLASRSFVRINRSTLANKMHISAIEPSGRGELEIKLSDGVSVVSGAFFHDQIVTWLEELKE